MPTSKNIETPIRLYELFEQYVSDCKENPRKETFWNNRESKQCSIDKEKPLTWDGFEVWLRKNKILSKLDDYKANKDGRYAEYADIIRAIDKEIYVDKYEGASVGIYQHNIIARDLGLSEKSEVDQKVEHRLINIITDPEMNDEINRVSDRTD